MRIEEEEYRECADLLVETIASFHKRKKPKEYRQLAFGKGEIRLLCFLLDQGGKVTPGDLAEVLSVGSGRIANALKDLEKKGFVRRRRDEEDKRHFFIELTPKGEKKASAIKAYFESRVKVAVDAIGVDRFKAMLESAKIAIQAVEKEDRKPC